FPPNALNDTPHAPYDAACGVAPSSDIVRHRTPVALRRERKFGETGPAAQVVSPFRLLRPRLARAEGSSAQGHPPRAVSRDGPAPNRPSLRPSACGQLSPSNGTKSRGTEITSAFDFGGPLHRSGYKRPRRRES